MHGVPSPWPSRQRRERRSDAGTGNLQPVQPPRTLSGRLCLLGLSPQSAPRRYENAARTIAGRHGLPARRLRAPGSHPAHGIRPSEAAVLSIVAHATVHLGGRLPRPLWGAPDATGCPRSHHLIDPARATTAAGQLHTILPWRRPCLRSAEVRCGPTSGRGPWNQIGQQILRQKGSGDAGSHVQGIRSPPVLELRQVEKPVPKDYEVLIKVHATTAHRGDVKIRSFDVPRGQRLAARLVLGFTRPKNPILGMELAGEVESVGKGVTLFKPGDEVFAFTGWGLGAYAEYICLPEKPRRSVTKDGMLATKPANMTFEEAAAGTATGGVTALRVLRKANIEGRRRAEGPDLRCLRKHRHLRRTTGQVIRGGGHGGLYSRQSGSRELSRGR